MKKLYALACFLICALIPLHAESYVLDYAAERQFSTISSVEYDISGEAGVLTFEGKYTKLLGLVTLETVTSTNTSMVRGCVWRP